jgi:hypothetical protein
VSRPKLDPKKLARVEKLVAEGLPRAEAARKVGVSKSAAYRAEQDERARRAKAPRAPAKRPGPVRRRRADVEPDDDEDLDDIEGETAEEAPPARAARPGTGLATDLEILDEEIRETRAELRRMRKRAKDGGSLHGMAALGKHLRDLVQSRAKLRPPERDPDDEEKRHGEAARSAITKIEAAVRVAEERQLKRWAEDPQGVLAEFEATMRARAVAAEGGKAA